MAKVVHVSGVIPVTASTNEWCIKKFLYRWGLFFKEYGCDYWSVGIFMDWANIMYNLTVVVY
jgi:hypothetical protein